MGSVTPEESTAQRVAEVLAERDAVQANLLELDGSFAKQVLEGAALTGQTRDRWAAASTAFATLWETFLAYSAVIDRVAALGSGSKRPARKDLPELTRLLTEGCIQLPGPPVPLAHRDLAASGRPPVTLAAAVGAMRRAFTQVAEVTAAVEAVWAAVAVPLEAATTELARVRPLVDGLGTELETEFREAEKSWPPSGPPRTPTPSPSGGPRPAARRATAASTPRPPASCATRRRRSRRASPRPACCGSRHGSGSTSSRPPRRPPAPRARTPSRRAGTRRRGSPRCRRPRPR